MELYRPEGEGMFHVWEESATNEFSIIELLPMPARANGKWGNGDETKKEAQKAWHEIKRRLDEAKRATDRD